MSDQELQLHLAKMLPDQIYSGEKRFYWNDGKSIRNGILDTEWLHVCWLVEMELPNLKRRQYAMEIMNIIGHTEPTPPQTWDFVADVSSASWQQRAEALCRVKGIMPL